MSSSFLPPHLTAQTLASQPLLRPRSSPGEDDGFEALALKSAAPGRVIAPRPLEPKATPQQPATAPAAMKAASAAPAGMAEAPPRSQTQALDEITQYMRPGSKLDIRV